MADDPRAVKLARRRMLITSKPKPKLEIPIRGSMRNRPKTKIQPMDPKPPMRLKVRK